MEREPSQKKERKKGEMEVQEKVGKEMQMYVEGGEDGMELVAAAAANYLAGSDSSPSRSLSSSRFRYNAKK